MLIVVIVGVIGIILTTVCIGLLVLGGDYLLYCYYKDKNAKQYMRRYIVTNKRAIIHVASNTGEQIEMQECNIKDVIPVSQNKKVIGSGTIGREMGSVTSYNRMTSVGDVAFFQGPSVKFIFKEVPDPDGIVNSVEALKKSLT